MSRAVVLGEQLRRHPAALAATVGGGVIYNRYANNPNLLGQDAATAANYMEEVVGGYQDQREPRKRRRSSAYSGASDARPSAFNSVTNHNDYRLVYQRKGRKRVRNKIFKKKVRNIIREISQQALGTKNQIFRYHGDFEIENPRLNQGYHAFAHYGGLSLTNPQSDRGHGDLYNIYSSQTADSTEREKSRMYNFRPAVFEYNIQNTGVNPMIFDVYEFYMKKPPAATTREQGVEQTLVTARNRMMDAAPYGTYVKGDMELKGVTLFEQNGFLSETGCVIRSKRSYNVATGQMATFEIIDHKYRNINMGDVLADRSYRVAKHTSFILIVAKVGAHQETDGGSILGQTYSIESNRKYSWKMPSADEAHDQSAYTLTVTPTP